MKQSLTVAILEAVVLAVVILVTVLVVSGGLDEFAVKRHLGRALDSFYIGNWDEALVEVQLCIDAKPDCAPPYELAGYIHLVEGDLNAAEENYRTAVENAGEKATPSSVLGLALIGAIRAAAEKPDGTVLKDAVRKVEDMRSKAVAESDVLISVAAIQAFAGDFSGARQTLRLLEGEENTFVKGGLPVFYNTRGVLAYNKNRKEDSIEFFRKAAKDSGSWGAPQANLSAMFVSTISALETTDEALSKLVPDLLSTDTGTLTTNQAYFYHDALGVITYTRLGSAFYDRSVEQCDKAIMLRPNEPYAKLNKGTIKMVEGGGLEDSERQARLFDEAEKLYEGILKDPKVDDGIKYVTLNALGILHAKRNDEQKSLEYLKKALAINKDDYLVYRNIGSMSYRFGRYDSAKRNLEKSSELLAEQEDVEEALNVLRSGPVIESASIKYTTRSKPIVGVRASVHSCSTTLEHCNIQITFDDVPAHFLVRPTYITCMPSADMRQGRHKLNVAITDAAGNRTVRSFDVSIDISAPNAEAVTPVRGGSVKGARPMITFKVYDELSAIDFSTLMVKYKTGPEMESMAIQDVIKNGKYCYDMPELDIKRNQKVSSETIQFISKRKLIPGGYRLQVEVKDVLGNSGGDRWDFSVTE